MSDPQSSFYSFLMEPMVDLEPGITAEEHHSPDSFNIELEQSMGQGSSYANTQDPKETAAKDMKDAPPRRTAKRTKISLYQKLELEYVFHRTPYPKQAVRAQLAYSLGLGHQTVLNWFKKRRFRWRRQPVRPGEPVAFPCLSTASPVQAFGQYPTPRATYPSCLQEPLASHQQSQSEHMGHIV